MANAKRAQKLKVYSTPIGFHDALVAAPSQKAALEAWGAGTNLFSQGSAQLVTDPKLTKVPLENPGRVVKVLRGSHSEQLKALEKRQVRKPLQPDRAGDLAPENQGISAKAKSRIAWPRGARARYASSEARSGTRARRQGNKGA